MAPDGGSAPPEGVWAETRLFTVKPRLSQSVGLFSWNDRCYHGGIWILLVKGVVHWLLMFRALGRGTQSHSFDIPASAAFFALLLQCSHLDSVGHFLWKLNCQSPGRKGGTLAGCTGWGYAEIWVLRHPFTDLQGICWSLPTPHPAFGGDQSLQFLCLSGVPRCGSAASRGLLLCRQVDFSFLCSISSVVDFQNCFMSSPLSFSLPF